MAEIKGGECLSDSYIDARTKLSWKCKSNHIWGATPDSVRRGSWCPECGRLSAADKLKGNIEEMEEIALSNGGKCLSEVYVNRITKLLWECGKGHRWFAIPMSVKKGSWCPICRKIQAGKKKRLTIVQMNRIAEKRGGKCLSEKYIVGKKLKWQCEYGHQWEATGSKVILGRWCPICGRDSGNRKRSLGLEKMRQIAKEKGGKCLSRKYTNISDILLWECKIGHHWRSSAASVRSGSWCPECSTGLGERICREFFEQIFGKKFPKKHPKWLINDDGNRMELDGYCESLGIAFEHQGKQHYSLKTHFITTNKQLKKLRIDDKTKKHLCKDRGILLIQIPEVPSLIPTHKIKAIIKRKCQLNDFRVAENFDSINVNFEKAYSSYRSDEILSELQSISFTKGGACLSEKYINSSQKLKWRCKKGHLWEALPSSILAGHWCPQCAGVGKLSIEEMHGIAEARQGRCLSKKICWLLFSASLGMQKWSHMDGKTLPHKSGSWCPKCAHEKHNSNRRLGIGDHEAVSSIEGWKVFIRRICQC